MTFRCAVVALALAVCASNLKGDESTPRRPLHQFAGVISVRLVPAGSLEGTVGRISPTTLDFQPMKNVDLYFLQEKKIVAQTTSNEDGNFSVQGLTPHAVYSVIATTTLEGQIWYVATGLAVLGADERGDRAVQADGTPAELASLRMNVREAAQSAMGLVMIPVGDVLSAMPAAVRSGVPGVAIGGGAAGAPLGLGAFGVAGGIGGGGAAGASSGGGLAPAAAAVGAGVASANAQNQPQASP